MRWPCARASGETIIAPNARLSVGAETATRPPFARVLVRHPAAVRTARAPAIATTSGPRALGREMGNAIAWEFDMNKLRLGRRQERHEGAGRRRGPRRR